MLPNETMASHIMGGEITWECNGSGQYIFRFSVYRDCSGANLPPEGRGDLVIHNYPNVGQRTNLPYNIVSNAAIEPNCRPGSPSPISCAAGDVEAVFEYLRETNPITLNGTPPAQGWIITYDDNARNATDNLPSSGVTFRAKILNHAGTIAGQCVDNSPVFREKPTSLICNNVSFTYNHNATDDELDSLNYEWGIPLSQINNTAIFNEAANIPTPLNFTNGFSFNNPFPGPESLNANTGEITMSPNADGKYVSVIKVTAYKCGEPVAEIYRELQSVISNNCVVNNSKPIITPPFQDQSGNFTLFNDTVRAGDLVTFNIQASDFASIDLTAVPPYFGDSVSIEATGLQFGTNFTNPNSGCINPPCATLSSPLPQKALLGVTSVFNWQTDCNHVSFTDQCVSGQNTYTFVVTALDDKCPIPALNIATISITVVGDSVIQSPLLNCVDVAPNGDVNLDWNLTPNINSSHTAWLIYSSTNRNGPFTLIDSVLNYNTTTYTHVGAGADQQQRFYHVRSRSGCKGVVVNVARDTVGTIFVDPQTDPTVVNVNWNPLNTPNPAGSATNYRVFREYPIGSGLTLYQNTSATTLAENFTPCTDSVKYRVDLVNTVEGCISRSNLAEYRFTFPDPQTNFSFPTNSCPGTSVSFTNLTTIPGGTVSYLWDFGDGSATSTQTSPSHTYAASGVYNITLTATSGKGCDSTLTQQITITFPDADAGPNQAICPGGSVQIGGSPTSSTAGVSYAWSPAGTLNNPTSANPIATPASTTTYTVTVTDGNNCTNTSQMTLTVNPFPTADAGPAQSICDGGSTTIGGSPTGPTGSTFLWNNAATLNDPTSANPTASPTVTTIYTVTVTSGVNCSATDQVTVTVNAAPNVDAGTDKNICPNTSVLIGGSPTSTNAGASFAWSNGATLDNPSIANPTATPSTTTTYTVTVTAVNGCTSVDDVTVNTFPAATADAGADQALCIGNSVTIGGTSTGTAPLTFSWSNGASLSSTTIQNPNANPTTTTSYSLTVTDANGCTDTDQMTVTVNPLPSANAGTDQTICEGSSTSIGGSPTGPAGATYLWSNAASLSSATSANPTANPTVTTTYTVTVTAGGTACTSTDQVVVTVDPAPNVDAGPDQTICDGVPVAIGGSPTSTTPGVTYAWSPAATLTNASISNPVAQPATSTTYTVTVTDGNNCTSTDQVTVNVNSNPTADAGSDLSICEGNSIQIGGSPTGPAGATYLWDNAASLSATNVANPTANPTVTTTYSVTVSNGNGCSAVDQMTLTVLPNPDTDAGPDQSICLGESVQIGGSPTTSVPGATFQWNNVASLSSPFVANPIATPSATRTYRVTVTHPNGCTNIDQVRITVNPLPTADAGPDQSICIGSSTSIGGSPTGPAGASYTWDNAASLSASNVANPVASPTVTTTYSVTVSDGNSCTAVDQVLVTVNPLPVADAGPDQTICEGSGVQIGGSPTGPAGSSFQWNNTASLSNATSANPTATPTVTTTYTVTVTDANSCTATDQVTVTVNTTPTADAGADQTICDGNPVQIGGTPTSTTVGATFSWNNGASLTSTSISNPVASPSVTTTYTVTVTHPNGCTNTDDVTISVNGLPPVDAGTDQTICLGSTATLGGSPTGPAGSNYFWDNGATLSNNTVANPVASPTSTTTYSVTVTNANGCTGVDAVIITVDPLPDADAGPDQILCEGSSIAIGGSPTSSTAGASFAWDNAGTLSASNIANPIANPTSTTTYTVTVTHPNGCTQTDLMTITVNPAPAVDAGSDQSICIGSTIQIGGAPTGPAGSTFAWDNGGTLSSTTDPNPIANPLVTTTYTVTVTDLNFCTSTDNVTISVNPLPVADAGADLTICETESIAIGGSPTGPAGSTFNWDNAASLSSSSVANPTANPTVTTTYSVTVTDVNGCTAVDDMILTVNPQPDADAGPDQSICNLQSVPIGGSPTSSVAGASFAWDNGASLSSTSVANPTASPTTTTTYTVTVTHTNGCTNTDQVTITVNPLPTADAGTDQTICIGSTATLGGSPTGPAGASFVWDNAATLSNANIANPVASPVVTTTYTVTVTDGNSCTSTDQVVITVVPVPDADAGPDQTICNLQSVQIGGSPTSTIAGASFLWDNAASLNNATIANPTANPGTTTTYTVTVTHPNGCTATDNVIVNVNPLPSADAGIDQDICIGSSATIGGSPTGPAGASFAWDNAATLSSASAANPTATPNVTTTYTVTVTDGNLCTSTDQVTITVNPLPTADAGADQTICEGTSATLGGSPTGPAGSIFTWDNAATLSNANAANPVASPTVTTLYTVTVVDVNSCVNTDQVLITVDPAPDADAGPDQTICANENVIIGGAPTSSVSGASFLWDNAASLSSATDPNPTASPTTTTTYTVTVTHPNGCTNIDDVTVTVNPLPLADAGPDQDLCIGSSLVIGGSPTGPAGSTFAWDNTASLSSGTDPNPTANPSITTTYTVTVTDVLGCTNTDQVTITVVPLPDADAGPDQTICDLQSVQIGGSPTSTVTGATFLWDNAASLSNATDPNPFANPNSTTTYTVTVTHTNGCTQTDDMTVTVNPLPVADAGPDQVICNGESIGIGGSPTGPAGSSFLWDNAASLSSATDANPTASPTVTTRYRVTVTDLNGCTQVDSADVTVNPLPVVDAGRDTAVCEGGSVAIGGNPTGPAGSTYSWNNASTLNDASIANPVASPISSTNYTVTVTDVNGCVNTDNILVTVNSAPNVNAGPDLTICNEDTVTIGGSPTSTTAGVSYLWNNPGTLKDETVANPEAFPSQNTEYIVAVIDAIGCISYDTMEVFVNPLPQVDFTVDETCFNDFAAFTDNSTISSGTIDSWSWDFGDGTGTSNLQNPAYQYANPGTYSVLLIVGSDLACVDSIRKDVTINPLPLADAGLDTLDLCFGDSIELGANPTGPVGSSFNWSPATDLSDVAASNPIAFPLFSTKYYLSVTDQNGCLNTDSVYVRVNSLPIVSAIPDTSLCVDQPVQLLASGAATYVWSPATGLSDPLIANPIANALVNTSYVVIGTDVNGCEASDTVTIEVFNLNFTGYDTSVCFGDSVRLVPVIQGIEDGISYQWSPGSGLSAIDVREPMASPFIDQKYELRISNSLGCFDLDSIFVAIDDTPVASFDVTNSPRCSGSVLELKNRSSNAITYSWYLDGEFKGNEVEPDFEIDNSIAHVVKLIVGNANCTDSIEVDVPAMPSRELLQLKNANVFTPNGDGINDYFDVGFTGEFLNCANLKIYDRWGDKVFDSNIGRYRWDGITMKGKLAPVGVYYYIISLGNEEIKGSVFLSR